MRKDMRSCRTEKAIREALMRLMAEKGYDRVSVKDICERADINRNTFYLHYADKEALMQDLLNGVITSQSAPIAKVVSCFTGAAPQTIEPIVRNILDFIYEERAFYHLLFTDPGLAGYVRYLYDTAYGLIVAGAQRTVSPVSLFYMINGFFGVVTAWMKKIECTPDATDKKIPSDEEKRTVTGIDEIAPMLSRLISSNLPYLHE